MRLRLLCSILFFITRQINADEEPGGWVEPGGYDIKAEESKAIAAEKALQEAEAQKAKKIIEQKKSARAKKLIESIKPENMMKVDDNQACINYGRELRKGKESHWKSEINRRNLKVDDYGISKRSFTLGSTVCTVYAAMGLPEKVNSTVSARYTRNQFIYPGIYIYVENGIVTSWQN